MSLVSLGRNDSEQTHEVMNRRKYSLSGYLTDDEVDAPSQVLQISRKLRSVGGFHLGVLHAENFLKTMHRTQVMSEQVIVSSLRTEEDEAMDRGHLSVDTIDLCLVVSQEHRI